MLIAMATYATDDNDRQDICLTAMASLVRSLSKSSGKHRIVFSDNGSTGNVAQFLSRVDKNNLACVIPNRTNLGTARAINKAWASRQPGEPCVKMDDDVIVEDDSWADQIQEVFERDPMIGICGLKRKDLEECPTHRSPQFRSRLVMLPHEKGQRWIVVEDVKHVMGTCQGYSSALLDKIGCLDQMQDLGNLYGFDDCLASVRAHLAGFSTVFLPHLEIDHIDPGSSKWADTKRTHAGEWMPRYAQRCKEYESGQRPLRYEEPA